jgi:MFS family permease
MSEINGRNERPTIPAMEADVTSPEGSLIKRGFKPGGVFSSLAHKNFVLFLSGAVLSNIGTWIQTIALGWLVYDITKSTFKVGLVNFAGNVPVTVLVLFAGVAADRLDRKKLIIATQVVMLVLALILAYLTQIKEANIPNIIVISLGFGLMTAIMFPTWQAYLSDIVPRKDLMNAIALNSAQFHMARLVGPALAGLILAAYGAAANFYVNAVSFLAVILALAFIKTEPRAKAPEFSIMKHLKEGFAYVGGKPVLQALLISTGLVTLFGMPYATLMPAFAREVLHLDAKGFGFMMAFNGLGALFGALLVGGLANIVKRETLIRFGAITFGAGLVALGFAHSPYVAAPILVVCGGAFLVTSSAINTSLQSLTPGRLRGRVMSMYVLMFMGIMPFAGLVFGYIALFTHVAMAISIGGSITALTGLVLLFKRSLIDQVEQTAIA